jgi:rod shape determining protein RodA
MIAMGWINIYAAVFDEGHPNIIDFSQRYGKQLLWIIATIVLAIFVVVIDNRFYFFFSYFIYGGFIFLLLLVLLLGKEINGARSWFEFGTLSFQPSEFAKFATGLALARYLNSRSQDLTNFRTLFPAIIIITIPMILTALQPDLGSTIVYFAFFLVLFREGLSPYIFIAGLLMLILFFVTLLYENLYINIVLVFLAFLFTWFATRKWVLSLIGLSVLLVFSVLGYLSARFLFKTIDLDIILIISLVLSGVIYMYYIFRYKSKTVLVIYLFLLGSILFVYSVDYTFNNILESHQQKRINIVLGLESDPYGTGYNVNQSKISIGSGGFLGKGFLQGTQTKFKFVPEQSTDFIFCTVGEEWGFIGSFVVIAMFIILMIRLIFLAERQRSSFSRIYGYGVVSILMIHFLINVGMTIGLMPVIGIPLPFFSYGGSSLWGFTILLFVFLRLDASRTEYMA